MRAYELMKTLRMDTSRNKRFIILFLNVFTNHLLSSNINPTDFKCHCTRDSCNTYKAMSSITCDKKEAFLVTKAKQNVTAITRHHTDMS